MTTWGQTAGTTDGTLIRSIAPVAAAPPELFTRHLEPDLPDLFLPLTSTFYLNVPVCRLAGIAIEYYMLPAHVP